MVLKHEYLQYVALNVLVWAIAALSQLILSNIIIHDGGYF